MKGVEVLMAGTKARKEGAKMRGLCSSFQLSLRILQKVSVSNYALNGTAWITHKES